MLQGTRGAPARASSRTAVTLRNVARPLRERQLRKRRVRAVARLARCDRGRRRRRDVQERGDGRRRPSEPLAGLDWVRVIVVDNASGDGTVDAAPHAAGRDDRAGGERRLRARLQRRLACGERALRPLPQPGRADRAPRRCEALAAELDRDERVGAVAPRIEEPDGSLDFSLRRFPRLRSSFAQALFLHRVFPEAPWVDEVIRDPAEYEQPHAVEWVSGACFAVRRSRARADRRAATRASSTTARTSTSARGSGRPGYEVRYVPDGGRRARGRRVGAARAAAADPRGEPDPLLGEARPARCRCSRPRESSRSEPRRTSSSRGAGRRGAAICGALGVALQAAAGRT